MPRKSEWIQLQSYIYRANVEFHESGNLQGNQYGLGIADLACQADEAEGSTACFAANTEIIPGPETGA